MKTRIKLEIEQEELHKIIRRYLGLKENTEIESDTNAGITTFEYEIESSVKEGSKD